MSVIFDGERSKQRKKLAESLLYKVKMLGLPAKTTEIDGFKYKVVNLDEGIRKAYITAPEGLVVVCATNNSLEVASADWIFGGFNPSTPAYMDSYVLSQITGAFDLSIRSYSETPRDIYKIDINTVKISEVFAHSFMGEYYYYSYFGKHFFNGARRAFGFISKNIYASTKSIAHMPYYAEYTANLGGLYYLGEFHYATCVISDNNSVRVVTSPFGSWHYTAGSLNNQYVLGYVIVYNKTKFTWVIAFSVKPLFSVFPIVIANRLSYKHYGSPYFKRKYSYTISSGDDNKSPMVGAILTDNRHMSFPEPYEESKIFDIILSIYNTNIGVAHLLRPDLEIFVSALTGHALPVPDQVIVDTIAELFGYPTTFLMQNTAFIIENATTFYSWSKNFGAIKFSVTSGLSTAPYIVLPSIVTNSYNIRPNITQSEPGKYVCVCEDINQNDQVVGIYVGSIYGDWTPLPMPSEIALMHARPIRYSDEGAIVLGVVKKSVDTLVEYYAAILNAEIIEDEQQIPNTKTSKGKWQILGKLPFTASVAKWSIATYGDGILTKYQNEYKQPPPICPGY